MFEHWGEFYLMAGSAAAVLIGLIFVVVSLLQDKSRSTVLQGSRLYMGPVVLHVTLVLILCAAALTPDIGDAWLSAITGFAALWGLARAIMSIGGIGKLMREPHPPHWTDIWFYGVLPAVIFLALGAVSIGFLMKEADWLPGTFAMIVMALIGLTVRNEWDLITWIAPRGTAEPNFDALEADRRSGEE